MRVVRRAVRGRARSRARRALRGLPRTHRATRAAAHFDNSDAIDLHRGFFQLLAQFAEAPFEFALLFFQALVFLGIEALALAAHLLALVRLVLQLLLAADDVAELALHAERRVVRVHRPPGVLLVAEILHHLAQLRHQALELLLVAALDGLAHLLEQAAVTGHRLPAQLPLFLPVCAAARPTRVEGVPAFIPVSQLSPANYPRVAGGSPAELEKAVRAEMDVNRGLVKSIGLKLD